MGCGGWGGDWAAPSVPWTPAAMACGQRSRVFEGSLWRGFFTTRRLGYQGGGPMRQISHLVWHVLALDVTGHHFGSAVLSEVAPRSHISREEERHGERQVLGQAGCRARSLPWGRPVCWAQVPWCLTRGFSRPGSTRASLFAGVGARGCWWECPMTSQETLAQLWP